MLSEPTCDSRAGLGTEAVQEMARYGIQCAQMTQFFYGGFRYTNLEDAIAEAKRHPPAA
jgi:hypothetical protein